VHAAATAAGAFVTRDRSCVSVPANDQERAMTTASVYMFNQTNLNAAIIVNNGNLFTINGTSDSAKWVANTSVLKFSSTASNPGDFNLHNNTLYIYLQNQQMYKYVLPIENANPGSIQIHIFFYDIGQTTSGLVMLYEGGPVTQPPIVIGPAPTAVHKDTKKPL
jgi:hypothetical protein